MSERESHRRSWLEWLTLASAALMMAEFADGAPAAPEHFLLRPNGPIPNHERLPVLVYRSVITTGDVASQFEQMFERNAWPAQWRNGVYSYHHYHSTAHEVLGFAQGWCRVMLGGEGGREVTLRAGDIAVLPAGTGHCRLDASSDYLVVGGYPQGQSWDICRTAPDAQTLQRIRTLPFPHQDPVRGDKAPIAALWPPAQR